MVHQTMIIIICTDKNNGLIIFERRADDSWSGVCLYLCYILLLFLTVFSDFWVLGSDFFYYGFPVTGTGHRGASCVSCCELRSWNISTESFWMWYLSVRIFKQKTKLGALPHYLPYLRTKNQDWRSSVGARTKETKP